MGRQHEYHTAYDGNADDMRPTLAEARRDEAACRRRKPVPREPVPDGNVDLVAALDRATRVVASEYRRAGALR